MADAVRQRYGLATGKGLDSPPPKTSNPGFAKGGKVGAAKGGKMPMPSGKSSKNC